MQDKWRMCKDHSGHRICCLVTLGNLQKKIHEIIKMQMAKDNNIINNVIIIISSYRSDFFLNFPKVFLNN